MDSAPTFALEARGLCKTFVRGRWWHNRLRHCALENVNLALQQRTTLALVGKSGCGKTALAMCLVGLEQPDRGEIVLNGQSLQTLNRPSAIAARKEVQLVFQDSGSALNPRMSAMQIVEEPLVLCGKYSRKQRRDLAAAMMERVGISPKWSHRQPSEFSGGQKQRLAIARALVLQPKVLIMDEIFVGLDRSIQNQIANLLMELQQSHGLSYLCISHNLGLVSQFADRVAVMDKGRIVDETSSSDFSARAQGDSATVSTPCQQGPSALGTSAGA